MIIVRSPLRVTLGGGGTDLPSYYEENDGSLIYASINKYVYTSLNIPFEKKIFLKYSNFETVNNSKEIKHKILNSVLNIYDYKFKSLEISSFSDLPSGTGLGSSGSFISALIHALNIQKNIKMTKHQLAELCCDIEINRLKEPVGKQDQYASVFGGINQLIFKKNTAVKVKKININNKTINLLEKKLVLYFTGFTRSASKVLNDQKVRSIKKEDEIINNLNKIKEIGLLSKKALENEDLNEFARLLNLQWELKQKRSQDMTNNKINSIYNFALKNGADGGKLVGAGGGGFLLFYSNNKIKLINSLKKFNLEKIDFKFDFKGTSCLVK